MKNILKIIGIVLMGIILLVHHHFLFISNVQIAANYPLQSAVDLIFSILYILSFIFLILKTKNRKLGIVKNIFLAFLSLCLIISNAYIEAGSLNFVYQNFYSFIYNIFYFIMNYLFLRRVVIYLEDFITTHSFEFKKENKVIKYFENHPFLFSFITIICCWAIYILAFYPIILSPDPSFQIKQFFNVRTKYADYAILLDDSIFLTNHHPVLHTLLLGGCLYIGRTLISDNFGLFIYSLIQLLFLAFTLSYTIKYLKENNVKNKVCLIVLILYCFVPMFPLYSMSGVKDTIYTCFIILLVIQFDRILRKKENLINIKEILALLITSVGVTLFRNNGIYVIILSYLVLLFANKKYRQQILVVFIGVFSFYAIYSHVLLPSLKITDGSIRETLSIPFQQTARYVKYHAKDLSKEDIKSIDFVLKYKTLAKRYNPVLADPVKNGFNKYTTNKELISYFKVWFKGLLKHPFTYVEATLHNTYGYFSPQSTSWYIYYRYDTRITEDNLVDYHYNQFETLRKHLASFAQGYPYIPVIGFISNIGFNTWVLLGLTIYSFLKKRKEYIIVLTPLLVSLLICVASPVNTYFRYAMPFVFNMPFLVSLLITRFKNKETIF